MIPGLVGQWVSAGMLDLPLPGGGETLQRFHRLAALTEMDVVAGRLAEAHADAIAILTELNGPEAWADQLWGVWAAEPPDAVVRVRVVVASDGGASNADATAPQRQQLVQDRRAELHDATEALGLDRPICLGLPDGELSNHEARLADQISELIGARTWCAATWRGDGHPDHEAVGRAAAAATERADTVLLEYPVWMWHWAAPGDDAVPWHRLHAMPLTDNAVERKAAAARCYHSQYAAPDGAPVLPPFVLERLLQVREVVFC